MGRHQLDGEGRLLLTYSRHVRITQGAIDRGRDAVYETAFLDGLARAVFDVTGLWPSQHSDLPQIERKSGL